MPKRDVDKQIDYFEYGQSMNCMRPINNNFEFDRPQCSKIKQNNTYDQHQKLNDYTFQHQQNETIQHPLERFGNIKEKSKNLDFSNRMLPNINMPQPIADNNSNFNPMFDRLPTIDTYNQKNYKQN